MRAPGPGAGPGAPRARYASSSATSASSPPARRPASARSDAWQGGQGAAPNVRATRMVTPTGGLLLPRRGGVDLERRHAGRLERRLLAGIDGVGDEHLQGQRRCAAPGHEHVGAEHPDRPLGHGGIAGRREIERRLAAAARATRPQRDGEPPGEGLGAQVKEALLDVEVERRLGPGQGAGGARPVREVTGALAPELRHELLAAAEAGERRPRPARREVDRRDVHLPPVPVLAPGEEDRAAVSISLLPRAGGGRGEGWRPVFIGRRTPLSLLLRGAHTEGDRHAPRTWQEGPRLRPPDENGNTVRLSEFKGRRVVVFFYPKANTSG